jgi:hypothetical protein
MQTCTLQPSAVDFSLTLETLSTMGRPKLGADFGLLRPNNNIICLKGDRFLKGSDLEWPQRESATNPYVF